MKLLGTVALAGLLLAAALAKRYLAVHANVGLPLLRLAPPLPPNYEHQQNCERIQRALADSPDPEPVMQDAPLSEDDLAIYKVVLESWESRGTVNLSDRTFPLQRDISVCECLEGIDTESLLKASHSLHLIKRGALRGSKVQFVDRDAQTSVIQANDPDSRRERESLHRAVDKAFAAVFFSLSEIAFDKEHSRAIVSYSFHCGLLCGSGGTWVLTKVNGVWKKSLDRTCAGWIS